ncbi:Membrane protein implicated in regulation of membrane protease activity [Balnearium lithotrophicum]|uniref:Membrane protein implicated in regulation of membrane protease activity n=1 Tax=Balnearium lithotrophicum TaxID=223788 RepID=A0A521ANV9_9BACT|nr:NfeD family protein [Balnearium lithotrophicum]SMO36496.1 Membrane protein implicated in regulation of membrane protease activity [Balnearium lithotrophicum]
MEVKLGIALFFLGLILLILELSFFTAYVFPIGFGFILSGIYLVVFKGIFGALVIFTLTTGILYYLSFKYVRKIKGIREVLNEIKSQEGIVVSQTDDFTYQIRFPLGAGGEEVWNAYSEEKLNYGDKVKVVGIKGNKLLVKKVVDA